MESLPSTNFSFASKREVAFFLGAIGVGLFSWVANQMKWPEWIIPFACATSLVLMLFGFLAWLGGHQQISESGIRRVCWVCLPVIMLGCAIWLIVMLTSASDEEKLPPVAAQAPTITTTPTPKPPLVTIDVMRDKDTNKLLRLVWQNVPNYKVASHRYNLQACFKVTNLTSDTYVDYDADVNLYGVVGPYRIDVPPDEESSVLDPGAEKCLSIAACLCKIEHLISTDQARLMYENNLAMIHAELTFRHKAHGETDWRSTVKITTDIEPYATSNNERTVTP
jgi:hypothetical protein